MKSMSGKFHVLTVLVFLTVSFQNLWASDHEKEGDVSPDKPGSVQGSLPKGSIAVIKVPVQDPQKMGDAFVKGSLFSLQNNVPVLFVPEAPQADPTINDYDEETGLTKLHKECLKEAPTPNSIRTLTEIHGADVSLPTKEPYETPGLKAVDLARQKGHSELAAYLSVLRKPNDYDDTTGLTLLHELCSTSETKLEQVKYLVEEKNADVRLKTKEPAENPGLTASEIAMEKGFEEIAEYLEEKEEELAKSS